MDVQELLDREAIRRTLTRYTLSGDRGRVDALLECFTPEGLLDHRLPDDSFTRDRVSAAER